MFIQTTLGDLINTVYIRSISVKMVSEKYWGIFAQNDGGLEILLRSFEGELEARYAMIQLSKKMRAVNLNNTDFSFDCALAESKSKSKELID